MYISTLVVWQHYFPDTFMDEIVEFTIMWIVKRQEILSRPNDVAETNRAEVKIVIGLLYLAGVLKSSCTNLTYPYTKDGTECNFFRTTMSECRFKLAFDEVKDDTLFNPDNQWCKAVFAEFTCLIGMMVRV